jgi:sugar phosphate isomerase/epimerase
LIVAKTQNTTPAPQSAAVETPRVILSAMGDEGVQSKSAPEQLAVLAALGLEYYSVRFVNVTGEVKNVMVLDKSELKTLKHLHADYGMHVASLGSPLGKVKLQDVADSSHNRYVPFEKYLKNDVASAIDRALFLETKLIRGFSFYHPAGTDPWPHVSQTVDQLEAIVEKCAAAGLVYGLEVEPNLVGQNGKLLAELCRRVRSPYMMAIFDGANLSVQNLSAADCFAEYEAMRKHIGWIHVKDYKVDPDLKWTGVVDEERLKNFVPVDVGDTGHEAIFRDFMQHIPQLEKKLKKLGVPGVFLDVEPHMKGGGQFGGFSGPDGLGVAVRSLCNILDYVGIDYQLRTFEHIRRARGF